MPRDSTWTEEAATLYRGLLTNHRNIAFTANSVSPFYDSVLSFTSTLANGLDLVRVYLRADSAYSFSSFGVHDTQWFLLDDAGYRYTLAGGRVERSGYFYVAVEWTYPSNASGAYVLTARQDLGADGKNTAAPLSGVVSTAAQNILRKAPFTELSDLMTKVDTGAVTLSNALSSIVNTADGSTSVATLTYQFFTGRIPTEAGIDYLTSPAGPNPGNLSSAYYQSFNLENRYINFAVNLGRDGDGRPKFQADYGSLSLAEATKKAYAAIFGSTPSDAKVALMLEGGRDLYFAYYGQDGVTGIGAKAAMVGWLLAEAEKADLGVYARSNAAFLTDLTDGAAFGIDLIGVYGKPDFMYLGG